MSKKTLIFLVLILILASFVRLWQLGEVPPSPDWDEAALGYNAYSIWQTGRDEYGKFLPIVLRSFDDYKPALYAYFSIPSIAVFGLTVFAVRLPSAIFGILTVLATYFMLKELFKKDNIALFSSFLLAISPWHIQFSRIAFESNVGTALNVFAVLFFLKGLKRPWLLSISTILAGLNLYVYQSEKVFTPLLFLVLILIFRRQLFLLPRKYIIAAIFLGFVVILPMIGFTLTNKDVLARAKGVSVFSDQTPFLKENTLRLIEDRKKNDVLGLILDNRRVLYAKTIISNYFSHFDLNWLFISGDLARHHAPNMGLLYLWELPFLLVGMYKFVFGKFEKKTKWLLLSWFLIAPIPASITNGVPHAVRTLNFLPTWQIFSALGLISTIESISSIKIWKLFAICSCVAISSAYLLFTMLNSLYYLDQYFIQQNYFNSEDWQYGYAKIVPEVQKREVNYKKIIVSNQPPMDQSYIFFLFYLRYNPSVYQAESVYASGGFRENHKYGKFEFRPLQWSKEEKNSKILYIGKPSDFPEGVKTIKTVNYLNGKAAMKIVEG